MFDLDKATRDAIRTDLSAEQYKDAIQRLQWCSDLPNLMDQLIGVAKALDLIKKYVFYGKVSTGLRLNTSIEVKNPEKIIRILHGLIGLATEVGEIAEAIHEPHHTKLPYDKVNVAEEVGDVSWYLRLLADELNTPLSQIIQTNVAKLKARYPDKFTEHNAINRDLATERKILEGQASIPTTVICPHCGGEGTKPPPHGDDNSFPEECRACNGSGFLFPRKGLCRKETNEPS